MSDLPIFSLRTSLFASLIHGHSPPLSSILSLYVLLFSAVTCITSLGINAL